MATKATLRQARYDADTTTQVHLKLNDFYDEDILQWLKQQENKQGYIKRLIRADMELNNFPLKQEKPGRKTRPG